MLRDHEPTVIEEFNGLWKRGDADSCPIDHFPDGENVQFIESGFETREGLNTLIAKGNILRMYNYKMASGESLLLLDTDGNFWHALLDGSNTVYGPILSIPEATDFDFEAPSAFAYITPFKTFVDGNGVEYQKGLENEFVYVYKGNGAFARKAAGNRPTNSSAAPFIAFNSVNAGLVDKGVHIVSVIFNDGGGLSAALGPKCAVLAPGGKQIQVINIPIGAGGTTERRIYMTRSIDPKAYDPSASPTFYLAATIANNTATSVLVSIDDLTLSTSFAAGGGVTPSSLGLLAKNTTTDGFMDQGLHLFGVVYETDTGYLTAPGPEFFGAETSISVTKKINISQIPVSPDSFVTKRHIVATKAITNYSGDQTGYQFFFVPDGNIDDNTTTTISLSFFDADLLDDASHLIDNFAEIPAGVNLSSFNGRMTLAATFNDPSVIYFSAPGEPEAIDQVDGVVIIPIDGNPVTGAQEFRDVCYTFKRTRTYALNDNGDVPATWVPLPIDNGIGCPIHGVCQVLDSGGINVEFLLVCDFSGIMVFNGLYQRPELTWKIQDLWTALDRNSFKTIQILNDTILQRLYVILTNKTILFGDYANGFNEKDIRWMPWTFDINPTTIALINTNTLAIGAIDSATTPEITLVTPESASIGDSIDLTGTGFTETTGTVTFDGVPAVVNTWENTVTNVVVPNVSEGPTVVTLTSPIGDTQAQFTLEGAATGNWYVDPVNGDDSHAGTSPSTAFKTLMKAHDSIIVDGSIIIVENGDILLTPGVTYSGEKSFMSLTKASVAGNPHIVRARNRLGVTLNGNSNERDYGFIAIGTAAHWVFEGFEAKEIGKGALHLNASGSDFTLQDSWLHHIANVTDFGDIGRTGIFSIYDDLTVQRNLFEHIGRLNASNKDHAIYIKDGDRWKVDNNQFRNNTSGWHIQLYNQPMADGKIANNTFAFACNTTGHIIIAADLTNCDFDNNVSLDPITSFLYNYAGSHSGCRVRNNITNVTAIIDTVPGGFALSDNTLGSNPMLVSSVVPYDFKTQIGSPARKTGLALAYVIGDYDRNPRVVPYDKGAFQAA